MKIDVNTCVGCGSCIGACPVEAIEFKDGKAVINQDICVKCGTCVGSCPVNAISE
jgi:ferredoxin